MVGDTHGIFEAERSCDLGGGDFTDAVSHHHRGLDAPRSPERSQPELVRQEDRLRKRGVVQARLVRTLRRQRITNRPARKWGEDVVDRGEGATERGLFAQEISSHTGPERSLAREDEGERRQTLRDCDSLWHGGTVTVFHILSQAIDKLLLGSSAHREAQVMVKAPASRGNDEIS